MTLLSSVEANSAFDAIAPTYDDVFEQNPMTRQIRALMTKTLLTRFRPGDRVIDLACGTGTDAVALAQKGIRVIGIDASPRMVEVARAKIASSGLEDIATASVMSYDDLSHMQAEQFDGCYSNFGGLNCTAHPESVAQRLHAILKPGSSFIACLMNRIFLWEIVGFLTRGKVTSALRRFHADGIDARLGTASVKTWYFSPHQFISLISPWFTVDRTWGISILSPSPGSHSFASKYPRLTTKLLDADRAIRDVFPFYGMGDHFVIEARSRKG